jgi:hypothetical protein
VPPTRARLLVLSVRILDVGRRVAERDGIGKLLVTAQCIPLLCYGYKGRTGAVPVFAALTLPRSVHGVLVIYAPVFPIR